MPYSIKKSGDSYKVITTATGKVHGTHPTKAAAERQLKAIYAKTGGE